MALTDVNYHPQILNKWSEMKTSWKKKTGIKFQGPLPHHLLFNLPQKSSPKAPHVALGTSVGTPPSDSGVRPHGTRPRTPSPQTGVVSCGFRPHEGGHPGGRRAGPNVAWKTMGNFGGGNRICPAGSDRFTIVIVSWLMKNLSTELIQPTYIGVK